mgnify:CR=1 FL=1
MMKRAMTLRPFTMNGRDHIFEEFDGAPPLTGVIYPADFFDAQGVMKPEFQEAVWAGVVKGGSVIIDRTAAVTSGNVRQYGVVIGTLTDDPLTYTAEKGN